MWRNPAMARALDILFILHADHEQNCSTNAMRAVGSSQADPYLSVASAASALAGPLHGGANEEVLKMLDEIGSKDNVPAYIKRVKEGQVKLMGFGHRIYKNYDPRAKIIRWSAEQVFEVTGRSPKLDIALELERIALEDDYFVKRKLYPNVDFYSGIMYQAMGFRPEMFTVLFAIPRTAGWLAQWQELITDPEQKIARPRQVYTGHGEREFVPHRQARSGADSGGISDALRLFRSEVIKKKSNLKRLPRSRGGAGSFAKHFGVKSSAAANCLRAVVPQPAWRYGSMKARTALSSGEDGWLTPQQVWINESVTPVGVTETVVSSRGSPSRSVS